MDISDYINELPPSSRIGPLERILREERLNSPIDSYRRSISQILEHGNEQTLDTSDCVGGLLVIGIVSASEGYFRSVLSACIEFCPNARELASKQTINLGGLLWHGHKGYSKSAFEHASFTSAEALKDVCKKYLGFLLRDDVFKSILEQFETVCQLRHGLVHGDAILPGKNAVQLNIRKYEKPVRMIIRYEHLQDIAAVVNTLVLTFNRELFREMCKRWAVDWRKRADWDLSASAEKLIFRKLWAIFHCSSEKRTRRGRSKLVCSKCYEDVKLQYGLT